MLCCGSRRTRHLNAPVVIVQPGTRHWHVRGSALAGMDLFKGIRMPAAMAHGHSVCLGPAERTWLVPVGHTEPWGGLVVVMRSKRGPAVRTVSHGVLQLSGSRGSKGTSAVPPKRKL